MSTGLSPEECALLRGTQIRPEELSSLSGWYPVVAENGLWWRFLGEKKFSEPFFHDTLATIPPKDRLSLHTGYDASATFETPLAPAAFIFHTSRCGSTLMTQLLASLPECIAMSEPPIIDSILRRHYGGAESEETAGLLRDAVSALGQKRFAHERHLFVKLDSWHIHSLPLFRRAFPDTPFLFLYRNPAQVIASHRRQRGRQMVPGLVNESMPPFDFEPVEPGDLDAYCGKILEGFFDAACHHANELMFVDYRQLPQLAWDELPACLDLDFSPEQLAAMRSRSATHSKSGIAFSGDPRLDDGGYAPSAKLDALYAEAERIRGRQDIFRKS